MTTFLSVEGTTYEYNAEAEGRITLSQGERWWGSCVKYRRADIADRRWTKFLLIDIHPFDRKQIELAINLHVTRKVVNTADGQVLIS